MKIIRKTIIFVGLLHIFICISGAQTTVPPPQPKATPTPQVIYPDKQTPSTDIRQNLPSIRNMNVQVSPEVAALANIAGKLMADGRYEESASAWTKVITANPKLAIAYNNRGFCNLQSGKPELAIRDFSAAVELAPMAIAYGNRGMAYSSLGNINAALVDINKAIALAPEDAMFINNRGDIYSRLKNYDLAIVDLTKAISLSPKLAIAYSNRCLAYFRKGYIDLAVKDCDQAIKVDSSFGLAYTNRAIALMSQGNLQAAFNDADTAVKLDPLNNAKYFLRGQIYLHLGKSALALADMNRAKDSIQLSAPMLNDIGYAHYLHKEPQTAVSYIDRALQIDPDLIAALQSRSLVLIDLKRFDDARTDLSRIIALNPNPDSFLLRAMVYVNIGLPTQALADYNKAVEIAPDMPIAYNNRANFFIGRGENDKALQDLNKAIQLNPNLVIAYQNRAFLYEKMGEKDKAKADEEKAASLESTQQQP